MIFIPCKCKCGTLIPEFDKWGRKREFVKGHQTRGENHPFFGKHLSKKHREGISKSNKGKKLSKEHKRNISINHADYSGESHPNYGKPRSDATKKKIGDGNRGKILSNVTRQLLSIVNKGKVPWNKGKPCSPETKQLISEATSGENHPNWQGGISKLPYCPIWTPWLKEEIKERDNHQCQNPDCSHKFEKLFVHHIDYDKKNCSVDNLITLCSSCNGRANTNKEYWKKFYSNILGEKKCLSTQPQILSA